MAKVNANYEAVFIIDPTKSEEDIAALVSKFKTLVEENATIGEVNEWGKRRLAYPISDQNEGYYVFISFNSPSAFPHELNRQFRNADGVIRAMVVCRDE